MEAEERSYLIALLDIVVADGAFPHFAVVGGFEETRPVLFYCVGVDALRVYSEVDDSFLHQHASVGYLHGVFSQKARYEVPHPTVIFELKLSLH